MGVQPFTNDLFNIEDSFTHYCFLKNVKSWGLLLRSPESLIQSNTLLGFLVCEPTVINIVRSLTITIMRTKTHFHLKPLQRTLYGMTHILDHCSPLLTQISVVLYLCASFAFSDLGAYLGQWQSANCAESITQNRIREWAVKRLWVRGDKFTRVPDCPFCPSVYLGTNKINVLLSGLVWGVNLNEAREEYIFKKKERKENTNKRVVHYFVYGFIVCTLFRYFPFFIFF